MGQLHELIAVEGDVKNTYRKVLSEAESTLKNKQGHFDGMSKTYRPAEEEDKERLDSEHKAMVTTVQDKLDYVAKSFIKHMDSILQKEKTCAISKADLVVTASNGEETTLCKDVPVLVLVRYEKILTELRSVCDNIPTLDPLQEWEVDPNAKNVYKTRPVERVRMKKVPKVVIKYEATKEHPAQTELLQEDIVAGNWTTTYKSGKYSSLQKSNLLGRIDSLLEGVKRARSRANKQDVVVAKIGQDLMNYINGK